MSNANGMDTAMLEAWHICEDKAINEFPAETCGRCDQKKHRNFRPGWLVDAIVDGDQRLLSEVEAVILDEENGTLFASKYQDINDSL